MYIEYIIQVMYICVECMYHITMVKSNAINRIPTTIYTNTHTHCVMCCTLSCIITEC